jgi:hypothetical protein
MMATGRRHFEGAPAHELSMDVGEVGTGFSNWRAGLFRDDRPGCLPPKDGYELSQGGSAVDAAFSHEGRLVHIAQGDNQFGRRAHVGQSDHPWYVP